MARVIKTLEYSIADVVPYINWLYFFHAWGLSGKPDSEKNALREEAMQMLTHINTVIFMKSFHVKEIAEVVGWDDDKKRLIYKYVYKED